MSEERFKRIFDYGEECVKDNKENLFIYSNGIVITMNELDKENEKLKHQNNQLKLLIKEIKEKCVIYEKMMSE